MANRLSEEKANAIASEYMTNGFAKVKALLSVGYKPSYANNPGLKLFDNVRVKQAIDRIKARNNTKTTYTITVAQARLDEAYTIAKQQNNPAGMVSSVIASNRMYGFDKDNDMGADQAQELTQSQAEEARRIANIRLNTVKNEDKVETG